MNNPTEKNQDSLKILIEDQDKKTKENPISFIFKKFQKISQTTLLEIFFLILFNITYIITLKTCHDTDEKCIGQYRYLLYLLPVLMFATMSIWLFYIIYNFQKKKYLNISFWIANLGFYYIFFRGYKWRGHGSFNMLFSLVVLFVYGFSYFFFWISKKLFYFNKKLFFFILGSTLTIFIVLLVTRFLLTKQLFYKGFKNTSLINNEKLCEFRNFNINWHEGTKGLFYFFPYFFSSCNKNYTPKWKGEGLIYQYPDTRKFDVNTRRYPVLMSRKIQSEMKMLKPDEKPTGELWVDFSGKSPELKMQIIPDKELIAKKTQLLSQNKINEDFKGLYILFIDALSRANFLRMYPTVFNFLEKYYNNKNSKYEVFQFFRFHSRKPWTSPNVGMWRYGNKFWNDDTKTITPKLKNIETEFSEKGFITAHVDGFCKTRVANFDIGDEVEKNVEESKWDHEFIGPTCDEEIFDSTDPYGPLIGPYSSVRRCLFGKDISSHMLNYSEKFHKSYKDNKTISSVELSDNHELTREVPRYIKKRLVNHFDNMIEKDLLNGKSNIFLADHGQHMTPIIKDFTSGVVEQFNPLLILILPRVIADKYRDVLKENEQKLIGMMDVREVMFFLASGEVKKSGGVNFVTDKVKEDRLPNMIDVPKQNWQCFKP